jgi:nucleoside-diphosphate-sugar epimerase
MPAAERPATVLITGVTGFVGGAVARELVRRQQTAVRGAVRRATDVVPLGVERVVVGELGATTRFEQAVDGVDIVIHAAARVHVMADRESDPLAVYRRINLEGTVSLARQSASAGVRRFVFVSSIKVNGEATQPGRPFRPDDPPAPEDAYGISKHEAEQALKALARDTGMEVVIVRPPLVYGPGVKANFRSMMRWLERGVPLPLGAIYANRRSLVALDNLVDLLIVCATHPAAANQTFLVSDGEDLSTTELLRRIAGAMGSRARLVPVPGFLLEFGCRLLGRSALSQRLCGSLQVDIAKNRELLEWKPPLSVDEGLARAAHGASAAD